jgi:hypothetical protein
MLNDQSAEAQNFLEKHVHARANLLIKELLEKGQRDWDLTSQQWYEDLFCQYEEDFDIWKVDEDYEGTNYCPPEPDPKVREPFEFWIVSDYFANKLKDNGHLVTNHWGFWIWGRETTGQSILIDYVFQKIWESYNNPQ